MNWKWRTPAQADIPRPVFRGFRRVLRQGTLIFGITLAVLFVASFYQQFRAVDSVRSVDHARRVVAALDTLGTYLLDLDAGARAYAESRDPAALAPERLCRGEPCPDAAELIRLVATDPGQTERLAPLPALQSALEAGVAALREQARSGGPVLHLSGFDQSAIEQIRRILIEAGRAEMKQLEQRERERVQEQTLATALVALGGLWTGLALLGLYRETRYLIAAGLAAEETIRDMSVRDPLTGLPNRRLLYENERQWLARERRAGAHLAVLLIDLDDFKPVNDRFGHAAGDAVLKTAAQRMQGLLREADVVARHGGDEFVIVLGQVADADAACQVAARVIARLAEPVMLDDGGTVRIGASVGVALTGENHDTLDALLGRADTALYAAKREGKNRWRLADAAEP